MALIVRGLSEEQMLAQCNPLTGVRAAIERIRPLCGKHALKEYQAAWLYTLAWQFNRKGARILEIGTLCGYSAAALAMAAPRAAIITLNPNQSEARVAAQRLEAFPNVRVICAYSWDYLGKDTKPWDMVFVDGDHRWVSRDMPWFNRLKVGGLMLFHDYSPADALSPCMPVYEAIQAVKADGRELDIEIVDNNGIGMAGFYRRDGENW